MKQAEKKVVELIPPDFDQCQVDVPNGHSFMTLGGKYGGKVRCSNKPIFLVEEKIAGGDGLMGSMTMCSECFLVFTSSVGATLHNYKTSVIKEEKE